MADERGEYWYLDPDVDHSKITVPQLRSILLKHGITYPSSAKKPDLLALFEENVLPQADRLQRAQARTKRSTRGIEDVSSNATSTPPDDLEEEETLLAPPPSARSTRRRTPAAAEEEQHVSRTPARTPGRTSRTPARTVPTKHARASDGEPDGQPAVRRNRMSATPAVKQESPEPEAWHRHDVESPFTQDNPFQSGSSPAPPATGASQRRKTHAFESRERRKSDAHRRKTFQPKTEVEQLDEGIVPPSRRTFEMAVARPKQEVHTEKPDEIEAGEEFTPEEQLELVRERSKAGEVDVLPPRRRKQRPKATGTLKAFSLTLLTTAATVLAGVWRQEKLAVGFCGVGRESTSLAGVDLPEWANDLLPRCEPCPPHATCYQDLEIVCDKDFIKKPHPLSLNGLVPLPATCEPDSEKTRRIGVVADRTVQVLRERNAKYECGETDAEGKVVDTPEVSESDLKKELSSMKRKGMSQEEFDDLFQSAIGEVIRRDEITEHTGTSIPDAVTKHGKASGKANGKSVRTSYANANGNTNGNTDENSTSTAVTTGTDERRLSSSSLAEITLSCSIRRSLRHTVERYIWQVIVILVTLASAAYGKRSISTSRAMENRAKQIAGDVFDRLANHAALNMQEPGAYPDQGISMTQLRDDVLRSEFSASRRQQLWARVQKKVEHNSNVRAAVRENHSGDVARMWEWVGPVKLLEDGRSSVKRESGRFSLGPAKGSPGQGTPMVQKWDEGHPVY